MSPSLQLSDTLLATAYEAARKSVAAFARRQHADGYWWGDLTGGDATLEADYLLLQLWLHSPTGHEWCPPDLKSAQGAVRSILTHQVADGGDDALECFEVFCHGRILRCVTRGTA